MSVTERIIAITRYLDRYAKTIPLAKALALQNTLRQLRQSL